MWLILRSEYCS